MQKDIKIKEKHTHSIRKLDRSITYTSRIKRSVKEQYENVKKEKNNDENGEKLNVISYATSKVMRTFDRGAREGTYMIYGTSKTAYKRAKMKLEENKSREKEKLNQQEEPRNNILNKEKDNNSTLNSKDKIKERTSHNYEEKLNKVKTRSLKMEFISETDQASRIKDYQKKKLIKEKQYLKNIKEHNYKNVGIKTNDNSLKIRTRENTKSISNLNSFVNNIKLLDSNDLMKKSKLSNIKQNTGKMKKATKKVGKAAVNVGKRIAQRNKRNRNVGCIWGWYCFINTYYFFSNSRDVRICIWFSIFK